MTSPKLRQVSLEKQLEHKANFIKDGQLYLVRCQNCGNRENYAPAVAGGMCAWCGWSIELENTQDIA
jgi:hypothetical protein